MQKTSFEQQNEDRWNELQEMLRELERSPRANLEAVRLPKLFRQVCSDLSLAQRRSYGRQLCDRLNGLVLRSYQLLHRGLERGSNSFADFFFYTFPQRLREEWRLFAIAMALFWVPFISLYIAGRTAPEWVFSLMSVEEMESMESMHGPESEALDRFSTAEDGSVIGDIPAHFAAFSFYVQHNISIGLRTFGMGLLFTVGAVYELIWEGCVLGAHFGYIHFLGSERKLWHFCVSHSSFELVGLIICAVAGLRLGLGALLPGNLTRSASLIRSGKLALPLLLGGVIMVFLAAIVEGFWSSSRIVPWEARLAFGVGFWILWACYFIFMGRGRKSHA